VRVAPLLILLCLSVAAPAFSSVISSNGLADAQAARSLLGNDVWARVVRIENSGPQSGWKRSAYPRVVYALVFELSGILWFYTDSDGTQSLSLTRGTAARDASDPGPLFRAIDRNFASWSWIDQPKASDEVFPHGTPPNACFVESVAFLLRRMEAGEETVHPELLSYYVKTATALYGHTVLIFGMERGLVAVDPDVSPRPVELPPRLWTDPLALSAFLRGGRVSAARTLPLMCAQAHSDPSVCAAAPASGAGPSKPGRLSPG
jgi:hypothetical protein